MLFCASSEGSGESARLHRLNVAFPSPLYQNLVCCLKWRVCAIHPSSEDTGSPEPRHSTDISCAGSKLLCASSEGSGESAHLHRLTLAFVTVPNFHILPQMAICVLFTPAAYTLVSLHICTDIATGQCDKFWRVCTFEQARLSLVSQKIAGAGINGDLCTVYVKSKCCGESAPATTAHLCNHQCVVEMRQNAPSIL